MSMNSNRFRYALLGASAMISAAAVASAAYAADTRAYDFDMPSQPLTLALKTFGATADQQLIFSETLVKDRTAPALKGSYTPDQALAMLLTGSGLTADKTPGGVVTIRSAADPQGGSAADGADGTVQALIVTAQKREEDIQDVPIAISAFTQEDLTRSQVAGGPDLVTQVPNFTFTKTNFSSYSIQIRGIGTQAISATTDPAVAVAFNNTPFIRNRFFEQEFYDLERVEVLRGPQGTLYGRNATAGVVNIISAKPKFRYEAKLSADLGNYSSSRLEGMLNIPLVEDKVALRLAGAWTKRDGYVTNEISGNQTDGRDLWSTRVSLRIQPNDRFNANLIWEHFEENDDRLRSGKQLCRKDVVTELAGFPITDYNMSLPNNGQGGIMGGPQVNFSQGCKPWSLYDKQSFQRPNGLMLPYYVPLGAIELPTALTDPYVSVVNTSDPAIISATNDQPEDLRVIQSTIDPIYRAKSEIGELQVSYDLTDHLSLASETAYATDFVYSLEDFNRFNTAPGAWRLGNGADPYNPNDQPSKAYLIGALDENGVFCDPQLGCSDRLVAVDVSTAKSRQFSQEFRLASNFEGPFNFSLGANFLRADSKDKYYVFINPLSLIAAVHGSPAGYVYGQTDNRDCLLNGYGPGDPNGISGVGECVYMDPNPIAQVNDQGHNYFLSNNPYKLISYAVFGEAYYQISDNLKATAGLRWTVDKKEAPRVPTWLLNSQSYGYPVAEVIEQEWREPTGRLTVDWKPNLSFTDETLIYGSMAHGYKAGGANPPGFVRTYYGPETKQAAEKNTVVSATRPRTFDPEFVNAFEVGAKNTLLDGRATANFAAFYYDYTGYQVSEIVDRSAFNRNFDATVWGVEFEGDWRPVENFKFGLKLGYEKTRIKDGEQAIDLMDRTAGDPDWVVMRPFPTFASSCIIPTWVLIGNTEDHPANPELTNPGGLSGGRPTACDWAYTFGYDPVTEQPYQANPGDVQNHRGVTNYTAWSTDPGDYAGLAWPNDVVTDRDYPGWNPATAPNNGEGIMKALGGNELPNAPHFTATVTGDYTLPLANEWLMTLHTDVHWQSQSWWRVFNDNVYDKLHPYFTMNLAAIFTNEDAGWNIMAYIKNVTDETAISGAFLNSDDTGLTTNVFLTEPRLYGLRVTKQWTGGPLLGNFGAAHDGPYPFTVEIGGQVQRHDAPNEVFSPSFSPEFAAPLDLFGPSQRADLDWGDGREVKLTYQPAGSAWSISGGLRHGETNAANNPEASWKTEPVCGFGGELASLCPVFVDDPMYGPVTRLSATNWARASTVDREEHTLADIDVGRDVALAGVGFSRLSAGLRYASLESTTRAHINGVPDWDLQPGAVYPLPGVPVTHNEYEANLNAAREFKGAGPAASWDVSYPLLGSAENGLVKVDAGVSGGLLFGTQKTSVSYNEEANSFTTLGFVLAGFAQINPAPTPLPSPAPVNVERSKSSTVPVVGANLGLSYEVNRFRISGGYRWERYYNAIDGGLAERQKADRTIDGPYFKIAVGFGG